MPEDEEPGLVGKQGSEVRNELTRWAWWDASVQCSLQGKKQPRHHIVQTTSGVLPSALEATLEEENLQIDAYPAENTVMVKVLETIPHEERVKEWGLFP